MEEGITFEAINLTTMKLRLFICENNMHNSYEYKSPERL